MTVLQAFEEIRNPALTWLFSLLTTFGEETIVLVVVCTLYWCINKKLAYGVGAFFLFFQFIGAVAKSQLPG